MERESVDKRTEPVERVRKARAAVHRRVVELHERRSGVVDRLRAVHPAILIGGSVVAGFLLAKLLGGGRGRRARRAVGNFAPIAAILGYVQSHIWSTAAQQARRWWSARARREEAEADTATAEAETAQAARDRAA